jgi:hypothetical protein
MPFQLCFTTIVDITSRRDLAKEEEEEDEKIIIITEKTTWWVWFV